MGMWFRPIPEVPPGEASTLDTTNALDDHASISRDQGPAVTNRDAEQAIARGADREHVYHPWLTTWVGPKNTAAGVIVCVSTGLLTAFVLNTGYVLSTADGMDEGWVRDAFLTAASPVHEIAQTSRVTFLSEGIQVALGRSQTSGDEFDTSSVLALDDQSSGRVGSGPSGAAVRVPLIPVETDGPSSDTATPATTAPSEPDTTTQASEPAREPALLPKLIAPLAKNAPPRSLPAMAADLPQPSDNDRLKVLIAGDSLSTYPGFLLQEQFAGIDLVRSKLVWHNGTGLTKPRLLDWRTYLADQVEKRNTDVVVMFLGANDMGSLTKNGKVIPPHTDAWRGEYALRVVAVTDAAISAGASGVIWVGPPSARSKQIDKYYRDINAALGAASEVIDGLYVVDLSTGLGYAETAKRGGQTIQLRQPDGIHWTRVGSFEPANAVLSVLESGYPALAPKLQAVRVQGTD